MEQHRNGLADALDWIATQIRSGAVVAVSLEYRDGSGRLTVLFQEPRNDKAPDASEG